MIMDVEGLDIGFGCFYPGLIKLGEEMGFDGQARLGFSLMKQVKQYLKGQNRTALPGLTDFAEDTVFNGIPFRSAGWVMTDGDGQAENISDKGLQLLFEDAAAGGIGATAIGLKQQMRRRWEALRQFMLTPMGQIIHRKGGCVR